MTNTGDRPRILAIDAYGLRRRQTLGGAQLILLQLLEGLRDGSRWHPILVTVEGGPLDCLAKDRGVDTAPLRCTYDVGSRFRERSLVGKLQAVPELWAAQIAVLKLVRRTKPSLLFVNDRRALVYAAPAILLSRLPAVVYILGRFRHWVNWLLWPLATQVVFIAEALRHDLPACLAALIRSKTTVIHQAVDLDEFAQRPFQPGCPRVVGTAGIISPRKNLEAFIALAERLSRSTELRFKVVGAPADIEDSYACNLIADGQRRLGDRLEWTGYKSGSAIYEGVDIFVLTSKAEGLPCVLLEAQAFGIPVLAFDVDGIREAMRHGETGSVVPFGDIEQLAERIEGLVRDQHRYRAMCEAARAWIEDNFGVSSFLDAFIGVLNRCTS